MRCSVVFCGVVECNVVMESVDIKFWCVVK